MLLHWLWLLPLLASSSSMDSWLPWEEAEEKPQLEMLDWDEERRGERRGEMGGDWSSSGSDEVEECVDLETDVEMLASEALSECLPLPWLPDICGSAVSFMIWAARVVLRRWLRAACGWLAGDGTSNLLAEPRLFAWAREECVSVGLSVCLAA